MSPRRIIETVTEYDDTRINEWEPYEQRAQCCQEIPDADPCTDEGKTEDWNGYPESEDDWNPEEIYQNYKRSLGDNLIGYVVDSVGGPVGGGPCGEVRTTWEGSLGCCEDPGNLVWGTTHSTVIRGENYFFSASGGIEFQQFSGYSWTTVGSGLSINGNGLNARLAVDICFCNPGLVICTDNCGQSIISLVSASDGSWAAITDTYYQSDYGWEQDGQGVVACTGGDVIVHGFNGDRTEHSLQSFGQVCYTKATESETDEVAIAAICAAGIAQGDYAASGAVSAPTDSTGYVKCDGGNVWYKDVSELPSYGGVDFHAFYQNTSGVTYEYTPGACEDEISYDEQDYPKTIADDSFGTVYWTGGVSPFLVSVSGVEFWMDEGHTTIQVQTVSSGAHVYTGDACGTAYVTVTDSCGSSIEIPVRSTDGSWVGGCAGVTYTTGETNNPYACGAPYSDNVNTNCVINNEYGLVGFGAEIYALVRFWNWNGSTWDFGYQHQRTWWCIEDGIHSPTQRPVYGLETIMENIRDTGGFVVEGSNDMNASAPYGPPENQLDNCWKCYFEC